MSYELNLKEKEKRKRKSYRNLINFWGILERISLEISRITRRVSKVARSETLFVIFHLRFQGKFEIQIERNCIDI